MSPDFRPAKRRRHGCFVAFAWILSLVLIQACSDAVSIDATGSESADPTLVPDVSPEASIYVTEDGQVSASGPVESVSASAFTVVGATFNVTGQTTMSDAAGGPMTIEGMNQGMYVEVAGQVVDDGSYVASSVHEDSTVVLCHVPPGHPEGAHTIVVGLRAMNAHLNHGDAEDACEEVLAGEGEDEGEGVTTDEGETEDDGEGPEESDSPKAVLCHIPTGDGAHARTIRVDSVDVQEHLDHGDYLGECEDSGDIHGGDHGGHVETDDGEGPSDEGDDDDADAEEEQILICHVSSENPEHRRTLSVDEEDVQEHLDHGDVLGACDG